MGGMRREQPVFKHLDLPTQHTNPELDYIVPPARDPEEIALRQSKPSGYLVAREQHRGALIVATMFKQEFADPASRRFTAQHAGAAAENTSHKSFSENAHLLPPQLGPVQRRVLKLPTLTAGRPEWRPDSAEIQRDTADHFTTACGEALKVMKCIEFSSPRTMQSKVNFGRTVGKAGLYAACIELGDDLVGAAITDADVMLRVRQTCLESLSYARHIGSIVGSNVTLAQLANPDSDLSVYWRREAPNEAYQVFNEAAEEVLAAA